MRLATAKISDKDSRADIDKVFASFDVNRAVRLCFKVGENNCFGAEESGTGFGWRFDWWVNWENVHQGGSRWRWICHGWWLLQHYDPQSILGSMRPFYSSKIWFQLASILEVSFDNIFFFQR